MGFPAFSGGRFDPRATIVLEIGGRGCGGRIVPVGARGIAAACAIGGGGVKIKGI
jgi:hypothetical protein